MLELADNATRIMKTRDWFDSDEINIVTNCDGCSDITYVSEAALTSSYSRSSNGTDYDLLKQDGHLPLIEQE